MNSEVKNVIDFLFDEGEKIKLECPMEVIRLYKYNIVPSGMGSRWDQAFTIMVFAEGDLRQMTAYQLWMLARVSDREIYGLEQLKMLFKETVPLSAEFQMTCGFESIWEYTKKVIAVIDKVETKAEFKELIESLACYANNFHNWVHFYFPWNVGELFHMRKKEEVVEMAKIMNI